MKAYQAVVPSYYLVWYNEELFEVEWLNAVVPSYYLVWYNLLFCASQAR